MTAVGVVICAYTDDRWSLLQRAVESVRAQNIANELVVVIDHNEALRDRTIEQWPDLAVVENNSERGLSGARNSGIEHLDAEIIAFLDDDAAADSQWLEHLVEPFSDPTIGLTSGRVVPDWKLGAPDWFPEEFLWVVGSSYIGLPEEPSDVRNPIGASMAVRRSVFAEVGLFSSAIGRIGNTPLGCEETELAIRAADAGHRTRYTPASVVEHHVSQDRHHLRYFVRRCRAEGASKAVVASLVGSDSALSSERTYVTQTIPRGLLRQLRRAISGPRAGALGAAGALILGCLVTAYGYAAMTMRKRFTAVPSPAAPRLAVDPTTSTSV